ncbi:hypothetical protein [uncultured Campylobacter sp.]|nr:hypothetical protein [uncultured Campylobacter sp.]
MTGATAIIGWRQNSDRSRNVKFERRNFSLTASGEILLPSSEQ